MTVEINVKDVLDPIHVDGDFSEFINDLNLAAAAGKQFVIANEVGGGIVAFETRNITVMRDETGREAFIGRQ